MLQLFAGDLEMAENGRRPHCKENHTGDFRLAQRAKHFFYAYGGSLNPEDGSLITSDAIREATNRLDEALKAVSEGNFKPDRENDEQTLSGHRNTQDMCEV